MARPSASPLLRAAAAALVAAASVAFAAPVAENDIAHTVRPGDTLEHLAAHYLGDHRLWPRLQSHNQVRDPHRLRPGSVLRIPAHWLPAETARVDFVEGDITTSGPGGAAQPLQPGQQLEEGARLQTGPDAFVSVRLADGTVVRVQAQSDVQLRQLRRRGRAGSVQSVLDVQRGGVDSSVSESPEPARRFEIRTPMATTSVRGTQFSVRLAESGQTTASVTQGSVAVQSRAGGGAAPALLAPGQGVAVASDGRVDAPRALLPAPDLTALPAALHDADILSLPLPAIPGAAAYQVQIARDADFTQVVRNGVFTSTQARLRGVEDGAYQIAVRGLDDAGIPGHAAQRAVTVKTQPVPPLYQQPSPGATLSRTTGELLCTQVTGARWYRIQVASDTGFAQPLLDDSRLTDCATRVGTLPAGRYYWRAASIRELAGGEADQGPFAPPQAVTLADSPRPLDASVLQTREGIPGAHLRWSGEAGQTFRLQVARSADFDPVVVDTELAEPAWSSTELPPGDYYVRLQVKDPSGLQSDFSAPRQIKAAAPIQTGSGQPLTSSDGRPLSRP